jgi:hypothetical protein
MDRKPATSRRRLGAGVGAVEIKVTLPPDQELQGIRALELNEDSAEIRVIYFYDTPKLDLYKAGVALRARLVKGDKDDTTVKVRPVDPAKVGKEWTDMKGFKLEADSVGENLICGASLTSLQGKDEIELVADGKRAIEKLFTPDQERFLAHFYPKPVNFARLKVLGPIRVLRWKTKVDSLDYELTSEEWRLPNGRDLLETSIKVPTKEARPARKAFERCLTGMGLDPRGAQATKTRTALDYFTHPPKGGKRPAARA